MISQFPPWRKKELVDYLARHERACAPLYGNLLASGFFNVITRLRCGDYFAVRGEDQRLWGVMGLYNDGNMMVHCQGMWDQAVYETASLYSWHSLWDYSGQPGVQILMHELPGVKQVRRLLLMERDPAAPLPETPPELRIAEVELTNPTREQIVFVGACMRDCFGFQSDPGVLRRRIRERLPQERYHILNEGGHPMAQAHIQSWTPHYAIIGGVACLPNYRGRGLATLVTASLCRYAEQAGRRAILTVDDDNDPALAVYKKLGFVRLDGYYVCHR